MVCWEEELACLLILTPPPRHPPPSQRGAHQSPFPQQSTGTRALEVSKLLNYGEQESVNNKRELTYKLPAQKQSRRAD